MTKIEWTEKTWNPIVGCSVTSPGCTNCYAMKMAARLEAMGSRVDLDDNGYATGWVNPLRHYCGTTQRQKAGPVWTGKVVMAPDSVLTAPLRRKKATTYFVNSMSDLFHESVPDEWIDRVFAVMALCPHHTFQVLTKRSKRMREYCCKLTARYRIARPIVDMLIAGKVTAGDGWPVVGEGDVDYPDNIKLREWPLRNVWLGVTCEDQTRANERIPDLLETPAEVKFVSIEPMLSAIDLTLDGLVYLPCSRCDDYGYHEPDTGAYVCSHCDGTGKGNEWGIDWVICGGESGAGARPMHPEWARSLRDQCAAADVPYFFKQWGQWGDFTDERTLGVEDRVITPTGKVIGAGSGKYGMVDPEWRDKGAAWMCKCGKKRSGCLLDGREHKGMPEVSR